MEAYTGFAQVYDTFMDDTPYEEWSHFLLALLQKHREGRRDPVLCGTIPADGKGTGNNYAIETDDNVIKENLHQEQNTILDLGCGTGTLTQLLAAQGYDMIGIDNAQEMLQIAIEKRDSAGLDILYLLQDMRTFELYGTVGAVISVCDSVNYLLEEEEIVQTFRLVNNYLFPQGLFIFDFNTVYKYAQVIGDATIAENREECSFIWDNYYYGEERVNEYELTLFVRDEKLCDATGQEVCRKLKETHYQRAYTLEEMKSLLARSGMEFLAAYDAFTRGEPNAKSERVCVVAREHGKEG